MNPSINIRHATPDDAEALVAYMHKLVNEPHNNIVLDPGQWTMTVEEERDFLRKRGEEDDGIFFVAECAGRIVGVASIRREARPTAHHAASLGVSVDIDHRRKGIGTALMRSLIDWAKENQLRRVELKVFVRNPGAIALYEKLGFVKEGLHRMVFCKQGQWVDEYTMAMILPGEQA
jgi:RimJ/RimL family protein N-acetyltransferase